MTEQDAMLRQPHGPNTVSSLEAGFRELGVRPGMVLITHASLSALGWVCGGAQAVILALENILTPAGTLVMPAHSGDLSDPADWCNPPVPAQWCEVIRNEMPCYDESLTPTRGMGQIPEVFRKQDGVARSSHPQLSFAARGKHRDYVLQDRHYDYAMNMKSPLGRVYELDGFILLIGVGHECNTSLHLAEYMGASSRPTVRNGMPVLEDGLRQWRVFEDVALCADDFGQIGGDYEALHPIATGLVGAATCRLIRQRGLVDFAAEWMAKNRA